MATFNVIELIALFLLIFDTDRGVLIQLTANDSKLQHGIVKRCRSEYRALLKFPFFFFKRKVRGNGLRNTRRENTDRV